MWLLWIRDVLAEVLMVVYRVEGGWVIQAERWMGVLAVETLLVAIDHCFPIEATFVLDATSVWQFGEINCVDEGFQLWEKFIERRRFIGYGREQKTSLRNVEPHVFFLDPVSTLLWKNVPGLRLQFPC